LHDAECCGDAKWRKFSYRNGAQFTDDLDVKPISV
jgi:hypothetical protein